MPIERMKALHRKTATLLWVLNLTDLTFTLIFIGKNWATEGNPILLYLFNKSVWAFVIAKLGVSTLGAWFLSRYPDKDLAVLGTAVLCGVYASLFFFQAFMMLIGAL